MLTMKKRIVLNRIFSVLLTAVMVITLIAPVSTVKAATANPLINKKSQEVSVGESFALKISNKPVEAKYSWISGDKKIAVVDKNGKVTGLKKGETVINCKIDTVKKVYRLSCSVTVKQPSESIAISNKIDYLQIGASFTLKKTLKPASTNDAITWKSSNPSVIKIDKNGKITALKKGVATITVTTSSKASDNVKIYAVEKKSATITEKDVVDNKVVLKNKSYGNLTIDHKVGNIQIELNNVTVGGTLTMESGAAYTVQTNHCTINKVSAVDNKSIKSFAESDSKQEDPSLIAGEGSLIVSVDSQCNISVKQTNGATIQSFSVSVNSAGDIQISLEGFKGDLVIDSQAPSKINIATTACDIASATVKNATEGQPITLTDTNAGTDNASTIKTVSMQASAALTVDVKTEEVSVAKEVQSAGVVISQPVTRLLNEGSSTQLLINNKVDVVSSTGNTSSVSLGETAKVDSISVAGTGTSVALKSGAQVTKVVSTADNTKLSLDEGAAITNVESYGDKSLVEGKGTVKEAVVTGSDTAINTKDTKVSVAIGTSNVTVQGVLVKEEEKVAIATPTPAPSPKASVTPNPKVTVTPSPKPSATPTPKVSATPTPMPTPTSAPIVIPPVNPPTNDTPSTSKPVINVWSYTNEVPDMLTKFKELNPNFPYDFKTTVVNMTGDSTSYTSALANALKDGGANAPDIFCTEESFVLNYSQGDNSKYVAPYEDLIAEFSSKLKDAQIDSYSTDLGTNNDKKVVGLGYQSTGGAFIYRRSIAKNVFGTDDPAKIQEKIGSGTGWEKFFNAALELRNSGYSIVSGDGDLWHAIESTSQNGWIKDGKLYIDPVRKTFLNYSKDLKINGYSNDTSDWTDDWFKDMSDTNVDDKGKPENKVFGFFGPAWMINYVLASHCGGNKAGEGTYGDWAVCKPPVDFSYGGTWLMANKSVENNSAKASAVGQVLQWITLDTSKTGLQYYWANGTLYGAGGTKDAVASEKVMKVSDGTLDFLGGQNMFDVYQSAGAKSGYKNTTAYDDVIDTYWRENVSAYAHGHKTYAQAIEDFQNEVTGNTSLGIKADPLKTINLWSFTDEVPQMLDRFMETYPDYPYVISTKVVPTTDGSYQNELNAALTSGNAANPAPDIFTTEASFVLNYTQGAYSDYVAPYSELIPDVNTLKNAAQLAPYTVAVGTNKDKGLVGLSYQSTGGAFIYRRSIAKDVWGTDDPATILGKIGPGWSKFFAAAEELKDKGYRIVSGDGDFWSAVYGSSASWIKDGKLYVDPLREDFLDYSKQLSDNNYSNNTLDWTQDWYADMKEDKVFGFFGPAWMVNYVLEPNCGKYDKPEDASQNTYGDWAVCDAPVNFSRGGTWIHANESVVGTDKEAAVGQFLRWVTLDTTDTGLQYYWANGMVNGNTGTKDVVASDVVMKKPSTSGTSEFLGGQDMFDVLAPASHNTTANSLTAYDDVINAIWREQVRMYTEGRKTKDEAIAAFKYLVNQQGLDLEVDNDVLANLYKASLDKVFSIVNDNASAIKINDDGEVDSSAVSTEALSQLYEAVLGLYNLKWSESYGVDDDWNEQGIVSPEDEDGNCQIDINKLLDNIYYNSIMSDSRIYAYIHTDDEDKDDALVNEIINGMMQYLVLRSYNYRQLMEGCVADFTKLFQALDDRDIDDFSDALSNMAQFLQDQGDRVYDDKGNPYDISFDSNYKEAYYIEFVRAYHDEDPAIEDYYNVYDAGELGNYNVLNARKEYKLICLLEYWLSEKPDVLNERNNIQSDYEKYHPLDLNIEQILYDNNEDNEYNALKGILSIFQQNPSYVIDEFGDWPGVVNVPISQSNLSLYMQAVNALKANGESGLDEEGNSFYYYGPYEYNLNYMNHIPQENWLIQKTAGQMIRSVVQTEKMQSVNSLINVLCVTGSSISVVDAQSAINRIIEVNDAVYQEHNTIQNIDLLIVNLKTLLDQPDNPLYDYTQEEKEDYYTPDLEDEVNDAFSCIMDTIQQTPPVGDSTDEGEGGE